MGESDWLAGRADSLSFVRRQAGEMEKAVDMDGRRRDKPASLVSAIGPSELSVLSAPSVRDSCRHGSKRSAGKVESDRRDAPVLLEIGSLS